MLTYDDFCEVESLQDYATVNVMDCRRIFMPVRTILGAHAMAKALVE